MSNRCVANATSTGRRCRNRHADGEALFCHMHGNRGQHHGDAALRPRINMEEVRIRGAQPRGLIDPLLNRPVFLPNTSQVARDLQQGRGQILNATPMAFGLRPRPRINMEEVRNRGAQPRGAFVDPLLNRNRPVFLPNTSQVARDLQQGRVRILNATPMAFNDKRRGKRSKKRS